MRNLIPLVIGASLGGWFTWAGSRMIGRGFARRREARDQATWWVSTTGAVVSAVLCSNTSSSYNATTHTSTTSTSYFPDVTYYFDVAGTRYTKTERMISRSAGKFAKAEKYLDENLAAGSPIQVFYDPADPKRCGLELARGGLDDVIVGGLITLVGLVALAIGGLAMIH